MCVSRKVVLWATHRDNLDFGPNVIFESLELYISSVLSSTGGHGRPQETTGGHGRPPAGNGRQQKPVPDFGPQQGI